MNVIVSPKAERDLKEAFEYIAQDSPAAANRLLVRFEEIMEMLASGLVRGSEVTLKDGRRVEAWSMPPYRIYFRRREDALEVLRVYHQAQRPIER